VMDRLLSMSGSCDQESSQETTNAHDAG
jgi:hypothetical protein